MGNVVSRYEIGPLAERLHERGRRIVLTNGCFDLLHVGHLRYLRAARALGDVLMVGVNDDAAVQALKGPGRPFVPEDERVELVSGLAPVDYAFLFAEPTAGELLLEIRPETYVKGGDYRPDNLPEAAAAKAGDARLVILPLVPGRSTSRLAETISARMRTDERGE